MYLSLGGENFINYLRLLKYVHFNKNLLTKFLMTVKKSYF